jgi:hypothetical protein
MNIAPECIAKPVTPQRWKGVTCDVIEAPANKRRHGMLGCRDKQTGPIHATFGQYADFRRRGVIEPRARAKQQQRMDSGVRVRVARCRPFCGIFRHA